MKKLFFVAIIMIVVLVGLSTSISAQENSCSYTVVAGDTLGALAANWNTTVAAIQASSNLGNSTNIVAGQTVLTKPGCVEIVLTPTAEASQTVQAENVTLNEADQCLAKVVLTSAGVSLQGCDQTEMVEVAETMAEEANPTVADLTEGSWEIRWFAGATDQIKGLSSDVTPWPEFVPANPSMWPEFPNVDNPTVGFLAADGLEYGLDESNMCENDQCDFPIAARHYRIITADYDFGFDACAAGEEFAGCGLMLVNVGDVTANFEDVFVDSGFTVSGRYWNGDTLPVAITAGLSHVGSNMLNLPSTLNPGGTNAGANCSVPDGCTNVRLTFVILSGNEVLGIGRTFVSNTSTSG